MRKGSDGRTSSGLVFWFGKLNSYILRACGTWMSRAAASLIRKHFALLFLSTNRHSFDSENISTLWIVMREKNAGNNANGVFVIVVENVGVQHHGKRRAGEIDMETIGKAKYSYYCQMCLWGFWNLWEMELMGNGRSSSMYWEMSKCCHCLLFIYLA